MQRTFRVLQVLKVLAACLDSTSLAHIGKSQGRILVKVLDSDAKCAVLLYTNVFCNF